MVHGDVEGRRRLARKADERVAVGAVVGDFKFHNRVVVADDKIDVLTDGAVLVVQDPDAVFIRAGHIVLRQSQLFKRAKHAARLHAAQLARRDVHAAGQIRVILRHGHEIALVHVLRAGDDLHRCILAGIDHAHPHVVGVFMPRHGQDFAYDDVFDLRVHPLGGLDLLTGDGHDLGVLAVGGRNINKFTKPFS